jgi:hypothetical protein
MELVNMNLALLKESEYNPRKITFKELEDLKESIKTFGITEPVVVNVHPNRKNIIISGHQRVKACKELGLDAVDCVLVSLDSDKEMELNIRMNKAGGKFDFDLLDEFFDREKLIDWGFLDTEFPQFTDVPEIEGDEDDSAVYPIVPMLSEQYNYVVIFATNEIDCAYLENFFGLEKQQSYKNSRIGVGRVVTFDKFSKLVKKDGVG